MKLVCAVCDRISGWVGSGISWLTLFLVLVTVYDVTLRHGFNAGSIKAQELEWHLFALIFLLGASYTLREKGHVRVDVIYSRLGPRAQALIDVAGCVLFLLPFSVFAIWASIPYIEKSYEVLESSPELGGLPYRYLIRSAVPVGFGLLILQGVSELIKSLRVLVGAANVDHAKEERR